MERTKEKEKKRVISLIKLTVVFLQFELFLVLKVETFERGAFPIRPILVWFNVGIIQPPSLSLFHTHTHLRL